MNSHYIAEKLPYELSLESDNLTYGVVPVYGGYSCVLTLDNKTMQYDGMSVRPIIQPNCPVQYEVTLLKSKEIIYLEEFGYSDAKCFGDIESLTEELNRLANLGDAGLVD